jgi:hypothetical protein
MVCASLSKARHRVHTSEAPKSGLYTDFLPKLNARTIRLVDNARLVNQIAALERRTSRGGKDSIDHPPNAHARFGLSKDAIHRHAANHLTPPMRAAILAAQKPSAIDLDVLRTSESEGLLAQLVVQRARLLQLGDMALDLGDVKAAVAVEGQINANVTLVAKLLGQLVQHHSVSNTNLLISPDYVRLRSALVDALRPYPDAARAVGAALHRLESDAAQGITAAANKGRAPVLIEHVPPPPAAPIAPLRVIPPPPC